MSTRRVKNFALYIRVFGPEPNESTARPLADAGPMMLRNARIEVTGGAGPSGFGWKMVLENVTKITTELDAQGIGTGTLHVVQDDPPQGHGGPQRVLPVTFTLKDERRPAVWMEGHAHYLDSDMDDRVAASERVLARLMGQEPLPDVPDAKIIEEPLGQTKVEVMS